jgi:hypothetical protein
MQEIRAEEGGVAEVSFTCEGSLARESAGELSYFSRDGVQLIT